MTDAAVVIPALNPEPSLLAYVEELHMHGCEKIIIVNDGSDKSTHPLFNKLNVAEYCTVLTHSLNQGKGRALKTAFMHFIEKGFSHCGVVTADADGQHAVQDVLRVAAALEKTTHGLILGCRDFHSPQVPVRSYFGNKMTCMLFHALFRQNLLDTQTGLRGIHATDLPHLLTLHGERFEFEMTMLIDASKRGLPIYQVPIQTLYFKKNESSHFNPIKDSVRISANLVRGLFQAQPRKKES
ncbi:glycosyltransferase family 2 protein [Bacillaceae bacterium SIJ1]|uniref:glycosyltransferase family 2 protein n=1 Tax=Litoribacterium kuwaitense TaxID=1398745 RepID=UPI0013EB609A|nr:glycosyltransferase family 2 protein [Litoribacterium kuwaitense]NGP45593.1 glycosyltransferase family 2 protein [Litoribacterium kuwaitense]